MNGSRKNDAYYELSVRDKGADILLPYDKRCGSYAQGRALVVIVADVNEPGTVRPTASEFVKINALAAHLTDVAIKGNKYSYADVKEDQPARKHPHDRKVRQRGAFIGTLQIFTLRKLYSQGWSVGVARENPNYDRARVDETSIHASLSDAVEVLCGFTCAPYVEPHLRTSRFASARVRKKAHRKFGRSENGKEFWKNTRLKPYLRQTGRPGPHA